MDSIDAPLNDSVYLINRLNKILDTPDAETAFMVLQKEILNRTNPGPGGFYDSMGDPESWKRLEGRKPWKDDPGYTGSPLASFPLFPPEIMNDPSKGIPVAWHNNAAVLYDTPLIARYEDLDPESDYTLGVKYIARGGGSGASQIVRLVANNDHQIHDFKRIVTADPTEYFDLPRSLHQKGCLTLTWTTPSAEQGTHIAELFLVKRRNG